MVEADVDVPEPSLFLLQTEQSVLIITGGMDGHTGGTTVDLGTKGPGILDEGGDRLSIPSLLLMRAKNSNPAFEDELPYWLLIISELGNSRPGNLTADLDAARDPLDVDNDVFEEDDDDDEEDVLESPSLFS